MGAMFWAKRYLLAAVPLFVILAAVEWFKGETTAADFASAGVWAMIAAWIFTAAQYRRFRKNASCAACDNIAGKRPE